MTKTLTKRRIVYPESDDTPIAETPIHALTMMLLHQMLEDWFRERDPEAFIATDIFWYYKKGDPKKRISPDAMVVPGAGQRDRRSFFSWREKVAIPAAVFEITSRSSRHQDLAVKYHRYESLGVPEYFLFDPVQQYLKPNLQGFRLVKGIYRRIAMKEGALASNLGFNLSADGTVLRLIDAATGEKLPTRREAVERSQKHADELSAEVKRLRAMIAKQSHTNGNGS